MDFGDGPGSDPKPNPEYEPDDVLVMDPIEGFEGRVTAMGFRCP